MRGLQLIQAASLLLSSANGLRIILSNDDSWATANIRSLYTALKNAGHQVLMVAPLTNQSGKGGSITLSTPANTTSQGEFGSVAAGSPSWGTDPNDKNIWYFDGTPATCTFFALDYVVGKVWNGTSPDLVLSGPNEGNNLGSFAYVGSGTIGAANTGVTRGIPGIAVSAQDLAHRYYKLVNSTNDISIYAANATVKFLDFLVQKSGNSSRLLPVGYGLNINLPTLNSTCASPKYELTRMSSYQGVPKWAVNETSGTASYGSNPSFKLDYCFNGDCSLPDDATVVAGCAISVSIFTTDYNAPNATTTSNLITMLQPLVESNTTTTSATSTPTAVSKSAGSANAPVEWLALGSAALIGAVAAF